MRYSEWQALKALSELGKGTAVDVAKKTGLSARSVSHTLRNNEWRWTQRDGETVVVGKHGQKHKMLIWRFIGDPKKVLSFTVARYIGIK